MSRTCDLWFCLLAALCFFSAPAVGQEEESPPAEATTETASADSETEADEADEDELLDDAELDMQGFDPNADDDFIPSEDIPADAPIAFPTDI